LLLNKIVNHRNILTALNNNINDIIYQKTINQSNGGVYFKKLIKFVSDECYYDKIHEDGNYDEVLFTYYPNRLS